MKKIFITYGDQKYKDSLQRIKQEAEALNIFDEIRLYDNTLLPEPFGKYTKLYERGGGYWLWKPWIVFDALKKADIGDIVVYADAGCTLLPHKDWNTYFDKLKKKEAVFFITSGKNKRWCKKEAFEYFNYKNDLWKYANQIQATFFMIKKTTNNRVIDHWHAIAKDYPELFLDVKEEERDKEDPGFREHRHDQAILTGCIFLFKNLNKYCFLPEKMERRYKEGQAVLASRISATSVRGVRASDPVENKWITLINNLTVHPLRKFMTLWLFRIGQL